MHLVRNSTKYVPSKDMKPFCASIKRCYGAANLEEAREAFESFKEQWAHYPGAVAVWQRNSQHIEQLFDYGSAVRKVMYTTNAIESINSSYRKVTRKGAFANDMAVYKLLYLRTIELTKKWGKGHPLNWSMVRNQLFCEPDIAARISKYEDL